MATMMIVEKGSRWVIGNGEQVSIWKDRWLPTPNSFRVVSPKPPQAESELVTNLIDKERGTWGCCQIKEYLSTT